MAFFQPVQQEQIEYDGFYDGQNKTVPEGTELTAMVYDGFNGIEEGKGVQVCNINIIITSPGEFYGQKYRYTAKIYDMDAAKRDLAMRNLQVLDIQAGMPMTNGKLDLSTENIQNLWAGKAEVRVKFGLFIAEDDGREINFVRGFGYLREKIIQPVQQQQQYQQQQQSQQQPQQGQQQYQTDPDQDF